MRIVFSSVQEAFKQTGLTPKERAVLVRLVRGKSTAVIAGALGMSPRTVQKHLQRIYQKLGVRTRVEAIVQMHRAAKPAPHDTRPSDRTKRP